ETFFTWCQAKEEKKNFILLVGGIMAGAYIGFAAQLFTLVTSSSPGFLGITQVLGGIVFSVGLIMVILGKAELFTGNCLLLSRCFDEYHYLKNTLHNWFWVYLGNFLGSLLLAWLYANSGLFKMGEGILAQRIIFIAQSKINLAFQEAFSRGILCNWLVCLAVFLSIVAENNLNRIFVIPGPVTVFVALGYEHSVANMYFLSVGMMAQKYLGELSTITWRKIFVSNLLPVTLGNIVGGSFFVGFLYWILLRERK
ncbi:MAG: formate/nitrite transporter family protein, partial [Candidatus Caldatribacteriaceae bacterium]